MKARGDGRRFTSTMLRAWGGLLAWASYFLVVYVLVALACERGFADARIGGVAFVPFVAIAALLPALAVTVWLALSALRRARLDVAPAGSRFADFLGWALGALAVLALAWTALPSMLLRTGCN
ncbi:MAG TPA: hypothetical protein VFX69_14925 [Steroidobacteraceae bacterium]|nr:hypothetical protein [Steroidobacteraceae bacterium]